MVLFLLLPFGSAMAQEWETLVKAESLHVERRPYKDSAIDELRGTVQLEASLNAIMALLRDAPYNADWVHRSGGARIVAANGYSQVYVYGIVDAPLPLMDRDTVVRFDYRQDPDTRDILIEITNFPDYLPEEAGLVRVPDFGGFWKLEPREGGMVEVTYQVHGTAGGWVPVWLANYAAQLSVTRTLQNMPAAVERYSGLNSPHVQELDPLSAD